MDRTVPAGAAILLDFIGDTEVGRKPPEAYEVIFGHNHKRLAKAITDMTIDELLEEQKGFTRRFGSSASGRYQFMRQTLTGLKQELGLRGSQRFDPNLQDRLGFHLLCRRGYLEWARGAMTDVVFGRRLAQEWASFPVLEDCQGAHRWIRRGETYYAGDKLNKALITPSQVEALLNRARKGTAAPQKPDPVVVGGGGAAAGAGTGAAVAVQQGHYGIAIVLALVVAAAIAVIVIRKWRK